VASQHADKVADDAGNTSLVGDGAHRALLVAGRKHRAADEPRQVGAFIYKAGKLVEVLLDLRNGLCLDREFKQRLRISLGDARYLRCRSSHPDPSLPA